jgi:hypothetical protein
MGTEGAGPAGNPRTARQGLSAIGDVGAIGLSYSGGHLYFTLAEQGGEVGFCTLVDLAHLGVTPH